jgi:hypothetical protein
MTTSNSKGITWLDRMGVVLSFGIIIYLMVGESIFGRYNILAFIPLFAIPILYLMRFRDIVPEMVEKVAKEKARFFSFDRFYALFIIFVTFYSIPYNLAVMGILVQDTWLNVIFTGTWEHGGLHHGWVGWFFLFEAYFYHRVNRFTQNFHNSSILLRNGYVIMGAFLFFDDLWFEEIANGLLAWPDIFKMLNSLLPYSWSWNFILLIGILFAFTIVGHIIAFRVKRK